MTANGARCMNVRCCLLLCPLLLPAAVPPDESFDYHSVRGRVAQPGSSGRFEGEHLEMKGSSRVQGMEHYGPHWSGDAHLLWDGAIGDVMESSVEIPAAGTYDIELQMTAAPDYGLFEFLIGDQLLDDSIDLYNSRVVLAKRRSYSEVKLKQGQLSLRFRLRSSNSRAHKFRDRGYLLGLDYIRFIRTDKPPHPKADNEAGSDAKATSTVAAKPVSDAQLAKAFQVNCLSCHDGNDAESDIDLSLLNSHTALLNAISTTRRIRNVVARHQMPPPDEHQPSDELRQQLIACLDAVISEYLSTHPPDTPVVLRRMNRYEYNNAVRDLLQLEGDIYPLPEKTIRARQPYFQPATGHFPNVIVVGNRTLGKNQVERQILTGVSPFSIDLQAEGGFNNRGRELSVSPLLLESFLKLGQAVVHSPEFDAYCRMTSDFFRAPPGLNKDEYAQLAEERLRPFLQRAFRQRPDAVLLRRYSSFFRRQLSESGSFSHSMKNVVAAVLASPRFIYLTETNEGGADKRDDASGRAIGRTLKLTELATRLSFFLWSSIPDEQLLAAALDRSLADPQTLDAQVTRMLQDPRSQALSHNFARQWMRLDQLITAVPDFDRYQPYYSRIGCEQWKFGLQTMIEPLLLFESIMVEDRSIMLLVDSNYSYRSDELQSWYRDDIPFGGRENRNRFNTGQQAFRRRSLNSRREGGIITTAATLTMTSAPLRTSPIVRGAWVATVVFNQPPPPPPDDVPPIEADEREIEARGLTLRQRLVQHQEKRTCAACHSKIDPLGFALENFDAVGRWRESYNSGLKIDSSGKLFGQAEFNGVTGLKDAMLRNPHWFMRAFCEHLLSYALGRELEISDQPTVDQIVSRVAVDHGQFTTVIRQIVHSYPFRHRVDGTK